MNFYSKSRLTITLAALASVSSLWNLVHAADQAQPCLEVSVGKSDCGTSSCVMVFARVGERFRYELAPVESPTAADCVIGENASGEESSLPAGLAFDSEDATLEGVPMRPGFYEFVVLRTEKGATREQVVLIDIQGSSLASSGIDYASYFSSGIR